MSTLSHRSPHAPAATAAPDGGFAAGLSRFTGRWRWPLLGAWVALLVVAGLASQSIAGVLSGGGWYVPGSASQRAAVALAGAQMTGRGQTAVTLVVRDTRYTAADPAFDGRVRAVADAVAAVPALRVSSRYGWTTLGNGARDTFLGQDRRTAVVSIGLDIDDGAARRELPLAQRRLTAQFGPSGLRASLVSPAALWGAVNTLSQEDLIRAEMVTLPLIVLILLLLYRSVVAAATSLAVGVTAIVLSLGVLTPVAHHYELSIFLENTATMLGLGVGVDYALFVISRFREELARGRDVTGAVTVALRTSGHTILYSGITVVLTMSALFTINLNVIESIALGAVVVVAFSMLAASLLLPVLLHILGHRINKGRIRLPARPRPVHTDRSGRWHRLAAAVMRRPALFGGLAVVALGALSIPAVHVRTFSPDARIIPQSSPVRQGYDAVAQQFGVGAASPVQVVLRAARPITGAAQVQTLVRLDGALRAVPHVGQVRSLAEVLATAAPEAPARLLAAPRDSLPAGVRQSIEHYLSRDGRTTIVEIESDQPASANATRDLVATVRRLAAGLTPTGFTAQVGGETAEGLDSNNVIQRSLIRLIAVMLAVVCAVLLLTFRSVALALKAVLMNTLSLGATYGVLVLVFQDGVGTGALGLDHTGNLQNFVPVLLLALLFSLSTDYEVFLLNRVREHYLQTGDNTGAVAVGMEATAPLISGAAILMVAVFGAFSFTGMVPIEQLGFGMAVAVFIDATIVRLVLVPAAMRLLGRWNWWMPGQPLPNRHTPPAPAADRERERQYA